MRDEAFSLEAQRTLLRALARTADARRLHGRNAEAERLYQRALIVAEELFGAKHREVATILNNLAIVKEAAGKTTEAEPLFRRAWRMREELLGADHPDTTMTVNRLAWLCRRIGCGI